MNLTETLQKEAREAFRKKWGRFYYSDTVGMDWEKPTKKLFRPDELATIQGSDGKCLASVDMERDLVTLIAHTVHATLEQIEREVGALHEIYDINDKPHISKADALSIITNHKTV